MYNVYNIYKYTYILGIIVNKIVLFEILNNNIHLS